MWQTLCLGARPQYNLVVDEDVKKPNKQIVCSASLFVIVEDCLIVAGDDLVDVIHTTITQFDCIFIGDFVEFVFWCEAHTEDTEEFLSYFGGNVFAIWRVEPSYFSFSSFVFADFF